MSVQKVFQEDRRLVILKFLDEDTDHKLNERILQKACETVGHNLGKVLMREELTFLQEQLCLKVEELGSLWVATLTEKGRRTARGQEIVSGVAEPTLD